MQVPEFWHTTPDDGAVYYVLRPPWVHLDGLQSFFTLHPEERHYTTSHAVQVGAAARGGSVGGGGCGWRAARGGGATSAG